jgi:hypothetical protein
MPARPRAIATLVVAVVLVAVRPALAAAEPTVATSGPAAGPAVVASSTVPTAVDAPGPQADPGPPVVSGPTPVAVAPTSGAFRAADLSAAPATASDAVAPLCGGTGADGRRVQAVYAYAGAQPDPTSLGLVAAAIPEVDRTYRDSAARTGGNRQVRWVTTSGAAGCQVSIRSVRITSGVTDFASLKIDLAAQGLNDTSRKYLVWTEGQLDTPQTTGCGLGEFWNDDTPGAANYNATNAGGFSAAFAAMDNRCWNLNGGHSVPAHELMHMLGAVQQSAPHSGYSADPVLDTYTGHCTDDFDAMCYGDSTVVVPGCTDATQERLFDCNNDDYFHTDPVAGSYLCTHWDTATNPYLWYSNVLQPPRPVPSLTLVPGAGSVSVSWTASPSCVPPDSYVVTVTGSAPVTVAGTATSVVRAAPTGPVTVTVTPSRSGVAGQPSSASTTVSSSTTTTTAAPPPPPPAPVQAPNRTPVGELLLSNVNRRDFALFGWALDPDTTGPVTVRIDLEGVGTFYVPADANWGGVEQRVAGYGNAHAFVFSRSNLPPGKRSFCVWAIDAQTNGYTALGCRNIVVK